MRSAPRQVKRAVQGILSGVCLAAAVLVGLAGCGVIGDKYVYIEWYTNYFEKYYIRWFDDFEREHADEHVRIKFRAMPSNAQQCIYTMLLSDTLSDVIVTGLGTAHLLYAQDALEPVRAEDLDRDDFMPVALKLAARPDGTLVAYPTGAGLRPFIYFSRKSLNEAGTGFEDVPETFDEYRSWASRLFRWDVGGAKVTGPRPDNAPAGATVSMERRPVVMIRGYVRSAIPFILAFMDPLPDENGVSDGSLDDFLGGPPSGRPLRFDHPDFIKGVAEYQKWFLPKETAIADSDGAGMQGFQQDVYAGMEGANWIYGEVFNMDFQVTRFPHAPGRIPRLYSEAGAQGVSRRSKNKRLAIEFAKFLSSSDAQTDSYYGHGYLPARMSTWKRLLADVDVDREIRERFLGRFTGGGYVGTPEVKRRYRDALDVTLYVDFPYDVTIAQATVGRRELAPEEQAAPAAAPEEGAPTAPLDTAGAEARYTPAAQALAKEIAAFSGQNVSVIVRGTPPDMAPARSFVMASPIPVYIPLLEKSGVWVPHDTRWERLTSEVISRMLEFVAKEDGPMTPEEAAKWAQAEAQAILDGRK